MIALENILPDRYRALLLFHHYYQITTGGTLELKAARIICGSRIGDLAFDSGMMFFC
jgi:hypothetical protein